MKSEESALTALGCTRAKAQGDKVSSRLTSSFQDLPSSVSSSSIYPAFSFFPSFHCLLSAVGDQSVMLAFLA